MAKGNYSEYLKKDRVKIKKYFYVLRPILACMWIEEYGNSPPMEFDHLLKLIESNKPLHYQIVELLSQKKTGTEFGLGKRIDEKIILLKIILSTLKLLQLNMANRKNRITNI